MKKVRYIVLVLSLIAALNSTAQVVDYYSTVNYGISVPLGDTKDFISNTSFRGFSFEFGRFLTEEISIGFLFAWSVFNESFPRDTYELEDLTLTGDLYRYINAFPLMAIGRYYFRPDSQFRPYVGLASGAYLINKVSDFGVHRFENKNWHFGLAPEAGLIMGIGEEAFINLGAHYNHAFKSGGDTHSWLSIQAGVTFIY
jgi:opacity protein-like surface antigen